MLSQFLSFMLAPRFASFWLDLLTLAPIHLKEGEACPMAGYRAASQSWWGLAFSHPSRPGWAVSFPPLMLPPAPSLGFRLSLPALLPT